MSAVSSFYHLTDCGYYKFVVFVTHCAFFPGTPNEIIISVQSFSVKIGDGFCPNCRRSLLKCIVETPRNT